MDSGDDSSSSNNNMDTDDDSSVSIASAIDDVNFKRTIEQCVKHIIDENCGVSNTYWNNLTNDKLDVFTDQVIELMGWFYQTMWLWNGSDTLSTTDNEVDAHLNGIDSLSEIFSELARNNYSPVIKQHICNYFQSD